MQAKIKKWGNSLGLRLPKALTKEVQLGEGSEVEIILKDGQLLIKPLQSPSQQLKSLLKRYPKKKGKAKEVNWGEQVGKEEW